MAEALLVAGHGSRDPAGVAECAALVARVAALRPSLRVGLGFLELADPTLDAAAAALAAGGATDVTVVPLLLLGAGHYKTDVAAVVAAHRRSEPARTFRYAAPLGLHPDLLAIVDERLAVVVDDPARTAVVLVGRGSSDPDANADLAKAARLLWEGRPYPLVEPAYVGITAPRVPDVLDRCRRLGAERVAVVPYFLFTGVLVERIGAQAARFAARHRLDVRVTGHLGCEDRVARLVLSRYDEARAGHIRPNCDLCVHRVALPGFEDSVGAPLPVHADDHAHHHAHAAAGAGDDRGGARP